MPYPTDAVSALEAAGWLPGRREDVTADLAALEAEGYQVWPGVVTFLESFTGLTVRFERWSGSADWIWFDATRAVAEGNRWTVEHCSELTGTRLVPVGFACSDHLMVMLGEDGRFFGEYSPYFAELARDPVDLVESLIDERHVGN